MSKKNASARKKHEKTSIRDRIFQFPRKMTGRLFLLLILCAVLSIFTFRYTMQHQTWVYVELVKRGITSFNPEKIVQEMQEKAKYISFQETGDEELRKLLDVEKYDDGYTMITFYDEESLFRCYGIEPAVWDSFVSDMFWYNDVGYYRGQDYMGKLEFQDITGEVMIYSMHQAQIVVPYFLTALIISLLFFSPVLIYVWNRMRYVGRLKNEVLVMAEGDLEHPVTVKGRDEIGILARNLDEMRLALDDNIRREQEGKKANHDLISSVSHDLRTPMTTLYGYLEIMSQNRCPEQKREEYLVRCIEKVEEIRTLSDKMFEYALVYETREQTELSEIYLGDLLEELEGHQEFLRLKGYQVQTDFQVEESVKIMGNHMFFRRMFNNLFSNILKYGERGEPVLVKAALDRGSLQMVFLNERRQRMKQVESNRIGLKSVRKMAELQHGKFFMVEGEETFAVTMEFPLI
ncbi:histidine kinase dimerization/phospho-acceptor domain-containing protein [Lachnospiraceae bacterium KK002]